MLACAAASAVGRDASFTHLNSATSDGDNHDRDENNNRAGSSASNCTRELAPIKVGWLIKRAVSASALLKNWRPRWIVLWPSHIEWSVAAARQCPRHATKALTSATEVGLSHQRELCMCVKIGGRELLLQASTDEERARLTTRGAASSLTDAVTAINHFSEA